MWKRSCQILLIILSITVAGTELEGADVVSIIRGIGQLLLHIYGIRTNVDCVNTSAAKASGNQGLFNNAAQAWNHDFYWKSMKAGGGGAPTGPVAELINAAFGSYENFRTEFENAGNTAFGSGWAWLVWTPSGLVVSKTSNADTPVADENVKPLLTMVSYYQHVDTPDLLKLYIFTM